MPRRRLPARASGLAVVSELAAYGGRVAIEDAPCGGARFIAELPTPKRA